MTSEDADRFLALQNQLLAVYEIVVRMQERLTALEERKGEGNNG